MVSPFAYRQVLNLQNTKLWNYHYPVKDELFNIRDSFMPKKTIKIGYFGSLKKEKGWMLLISSLRQMKNMKLKLMGGNKKEVENALNYARKLKVQDRVEFTGFVDQKNLPKEIREIDILAAPFEEEQRTIPLKVYEYLATNIPVVSSDMEVVKIVAKDYFYYFEPENEGSFVKTINKIVSSVSSVNKKLDESRIYASNFQWKNVIKKIVEDLKENS